jgi:hypothetical protein
MLELMMWLLVGAGEPPRDRSLLPSLLADHDHRKQI